MKTIIITGNDLTIEDLKAVSRDNVPVRLDKEAEKRISASRKIVDKLVTEKKEILANAEIIRRTLCNADALQEEKRQLENEMAVLADMAQTIIAENARIAQDQGEYQKRYDGVAVRYEAAKAKYEETAAAISAKEAQSARLEAFIETLKEQDGIIEDFDESLWGSMVDYVTVGRGKDMMVTFRDGTEIDV